VDIEETKVNEDAEAQTPPEQESPAAEPPVEPPAPEETETPAEPEAPEEVVEAAEPVAEEAEGEPAAAEQVPDETPEEAPRRPPAEAPGDAKYYGTGRRKDAVARVWIRRGSGSFTINKMPMANYLRRRSLEISVVQPLVVADLEGRIDIDARVTGGGISGQAGAVRHGIARALLELNPDLRSALRRAGFLTRDPRVKERKKYGLRRARRAFQFTKR
jgi:small subunit ribosomal protein S9